VDLNRRALLGTILTLGFLTTLQAAPQLKLSNTTVGPITVAVGANGVSPQPIYATNGGTGQLNLTATSSVSWLVPKLSSLQSCALLGTLCQTISFTLNTSALQAGTYTGVVTVSDPNAVDSPQTITATVIVGGGVPNAITMYVPQNGTPATTTFTTGTLIKPAVTSPSNGPTLSVAVPVGGSFQSTFSYTVTATNKAGVANGNYNGSITVSGSSIAGENKTVPVMLDVTSMPIATFTTPTTFRVAQGAKPQTQYLIAYNLGMGTLTPGDVSVSTTGGGSWLTGQVVSGFIGLTADPGTLAPDTYTGTVTIASNAVNNSVSFPVEMDVVAAGPPLIDPQGIKSNADFTSGGLFAQGDLPAIFGEQFTTGDPQAADGAPWQTTVGGAQVLVNGTPAPLYYVSQTQINFQVPYETAAGTAIVQVVRDGTMGNRVSMQVAARAPKLLVATDQAGNVVSRPVQNLSNGVVYGGAAAPVTAGDYITIYSLGFGQAATAVPTGQAAPNQVDNIPGSNFVYFGQVGVGNAIAVIPQYFGVAPGYVGLYQVNVQVPATLPKGPIPVFVQGDAGTSNSLPLIIQ
jgi:uncharacterized protein (TIGR03437 family)